MVSVFGTSLPSGRVDLNTIARVQGELQEKVDTIFIQLRRLLYLNILRTINKAEYYTLATPDSHYTNIDYTPRKRVSGNYASESYGHTPYSSSIPF